MFSLSMVFFGLSLDAANWTALGEKMKRRVRTRLSNTARAAKQSKASFEARLRHTCWYPLSR
jgi:hypothetical protein